MLEDFTDERAPRHLGRHRLRWCAPTSGRGGPRRNRGGVKDAARSYRQGSGDRRALGKASV